MDEADGHAFLDEVAEDFEEGDEAATLLDMEVFDVGGDDPEKLFGGGDQFLDDPLVDVFVEEEGGGHFVPGYWLLVIGYWLSGEEGWRWCGGEGERRGGDEERGAKGEQRS